MKKLIEQLEKATKSDSDLDADIYAALGARRPTDDAPLYWTSPDGKSRHYDSLIPRYTASVDAAVLLVPEGCAWQCGCEIDFTPVARVWGHDIHSDEFAATPAIALCIAALKARAQLKSRAA